jgi:hypothetical protein
MAPPLSAGLTIKSSSVSLRLWIWIVVVNLRYIWFCRFLVFLNSSFEIMINVWNVVLKVTVNLSSGIAVVKLFGSLKGCLYLCLFCVWRSICCTCFILYLRKSYKFACILLVWGNGCETSLWIVLYFVDLDMFISNGLITALYYRLLSIFCVISFC